MFSYIQYYGHVKIIESYCLIAFLASLILTIRIIEDKSYKYEFNKGIIEKTPRRMKIKELYISQNIKRAFCQTEAYKNGGEIFGVCAR